MQIVLHSDEDDNSRTLILEILINGKRYFQYASQNFYMISEGNEMLIFVVIDLNDHFKHKD